MGHHQKRVPVGHGLHGIIREMVQSLIVLCDDNNNNNNINNNNKQFKQNSFLGKFIYKNI